MIDCIRTGLMAVLLAALAAAVLAAVLPSVARLLGRLVRGSAALAVLAVVCIIYGGTKKVSFPRTDPDVAYLVDNGSYVTNDLVHLDFSRVLAPATASFFLDCRPSSSTDDADWATVYANTFADFTLPLDVPYTNATNYQWIAYTTWSQGQSVATNGVWHTWWGETKARNYIIPLRATVRDNGAVLGTPAAVRNQKETK